MPLRLDNARALPTCPQQQTKKTFKPRFKVDHAASPMPKTRQPERLPPRATSNRNGGRDHLGILGEIKSVHPGEIIGIRTRPNLRRPIRIIPANFLLRFGPSRCEPIAIGRVELLTPSGARIHSRTSY